METLQDENYQFGPDLGDGFFGTCKIVFRRGIAFAAKLIKPHGRKNLVVI